ncbi:hypothetical protein BDZ89DRAFT_1073853, partial [Hymenopellis radicata]
MRFANVCLVLLASFLATHGAPIEATMDVIPSDRTTLTPTPLPSVITEVPSPEPDYGEEGRRGTDGSDYNRDW